MNPTRKTLLLLGLCAMIVIGLLMYWAYSQKSPAQSPALTDAGVLLLPHGRAVPAVSMTDQNGAPVRLDQLTGHWTLLFFGYTYCPDICPTTLAQLRQVSAALPEASRQRLQIVLVSVDPGRDTPQQLKQYLAYFDPAFRGLAGSSETLQVLARSLSIPYLPADTSKPGYTVQHSGNLALLGPDGTQRGFVRAPFSNQKLIAVLPDLLNGE